jgi:hypothetical protein
MPAGKTETLSFRMAPDLKEALRLAAEREHRSIANMVEVMILDYCERTGIRIGKGRGAARARRSATVAP